MNEETCVCCGDIIPEGRQVCPLCEKPIIYEEHLKDKYIHKISIMSDKYGSLLIKMMNMYKAQSLQELTFEQVDEFYDIVTNKKSNRMKGGLFLCVNVLLRMV